MVYDSKAQSTAATAQRASPASGESCRSTLPFPRTPVAATTVK
jgi:hypothetical protein